MILGIAGCCLIGLLGAIPALILGLMAKKELAANPHQKGAGMATTAVILGIVGIVVGVIALILIVSGVISVAKLAGQCASNPNAAGCKSTRDMAPQPSWAGGVLEGPSPSHAATMRLLAPVPLVLR